MELVKTFREDKHNALATAVYNAAGCNNKDEKDKLYSYLENAPMASYITEVVDELEKLGFTITKQ